MTKMTKIHKIHKIQEREKIQKSEKSEKKKNKTRRRRGLWLCLKRVRVYEEEFVLWSGVVALLVRRDAQVVAARGLCRGHRPARALVVGKGKRERERECGGWRKARERESLKVAQLGPTRGAACASALASAQQAAIQNST